MRPFANICLISAQFPILDYVVYADEKNPNGILGELIFMFIDIIIFLCLLFAVEAGYFQRLMKFIMEKLHGTDFVEITVNQDVKLEKEKVNRLKNDFKGNFFKHVPTIHIQFSLINREPLYTSS